MKANRLTALTSCIIAFAALSLTACPGQGTDQIHGMVQVNFSSTAVCQAQTRDIQFRNVSGEDLLIRGAAVAQGSDPEGNFRLLGVTINGTFSDAVANALHDLTIPPNSVYSFQVSYKPRSFVPNDPDLSHGAVIDIAYIKPREGVIQIALAGTPAARSPTCPSIDEGGSSIGVGDLNGALTITVSRIVLFTSAIPAPIGTDIHTVHPFVPKDLPVTFDAEGNTLVLHAIPASLEFKLPPTTDPPLGDVITGDTLVTSTADAEGTYGDDGAITLDDVPIRLDEEFHTDFIVSLTTGVLNLPANTPAASLEAVGFRVSEDSTRISGSSIDPETFKLTLIGIGIFPKESVSGTGSVAQNLKGGSVSGIVQIEATVNKL